MIEDKKLAIEHGILDLIEQDGRVTQTEMANSLRISIGLLNSYIKRLVKKGYIKVANFKATNVKYILTPDGIAQKYHLTRAYMARSLDLYRKIKQAVELRIQRLKMQEVRNVVFVGAGEIAEIMYLYLGETRIELIGVYDVNGSVGTKFFEYNVRPLSELKTFMANNEIDKILLNVFDDVDKLEKLLDDMGIPADKIEKEW